MADHQHCLSDIMHSRNGFCGNLNGHSRSHGRKEEGRTSGELRPIAPIVQPANPRALRGPRRDPVPSGTVAGVFVTRTLSVHEGRATERRARTSSASGPTYLLGVTEAAVACNWVLPMLAFPPGGCTSNNYFFRINFGHRKWTTYRETSDAAIIGVQHR